MPIRIENVVLLCNEDSIFKMSGNNNILKNISTYNIFKYSYKTSKNPFRKVFYYIGTIFRSLADICFGIDSGYKYCCIKAFITGQKHVIKEIDYVLCHRCYKKLLKKN